MRCYSRRKYGLTSRYDPQARKPRRPTDTNARWRPRSSEVTRAVRFIERSGVLPVLEQELDSNVGRPRFLSLKALLVAALVNGFQDGHRALIRKIAVTIDGLSKHRLKELGCRLDHWPNDLYRRVDDLYNNLCRALEHGFEAEIDGEAVWVDHVWFHNRIGSSPVPESLRRSTSLAIDGTDVETAARLHSGSEEIETNGSEQPKRTSETTSSSEEQRPKALVLAQGDDGRKIYTLDPDARGGYRTRTNRRPGGTFVGYELHLGVQTPDVTYTNGVDVATLGGPVPGLILLSSLVPAGSSKAEAVVPLLLEQKRTGAPIDDIVVDPGYTIPDPAEFFTPLHKAGIHITYQITSHHRGVQPFNDHAIVLHGHLVSSTLPKKYRELALPPLGANQEERAPYEENWNHVARHFRFSLHKHPNSKGVTRWKDPLDAGRLRSRDVPRSMRGPKTSPLVKVKNPSSWEKTVRATPESLPRWSKWMTGTTAHRVAYYGRRQVAESANAALEGEFASINSRHFRVFELHKINILLAFTIAGYNDDRIRAFCAAHQEPNPNDAEADATSPSPQDEDEPTEADDGPAKEGRDPPG